MPDYNKRKNELLHEKLRNNLPLKISQEENQQLKNNWPIQKIIGYVQMQNLKILINKKVLIPRYETEELILKAYDFINHNSEVLDLCSGSGFIGLAIKKNTLAKKVVLADIDNQAIEQSKINAKLNNLDVEIIQSNLFSNIDENQKFDLIISNPPYIPLEEKLDNSVLNFEPHHALFAKENGNYFYRKILEAAPTFLKPHGIIMFEISPHQVDFFQKLSNAQIIKDINQKERIVIIKH